ncbi:MAG TPA: hypothetical protein VFI06_02055, partial [Chitinophagaceae bacterium]|nr:hypothetical protein [Chitinophagaceae bacterium]
MIRLILPAFLALFLFSSCKKEKSNSSKGPNLVLKFKFDPAQARLNNVGQAEPLPAGHGGQSPDFNKMSAHYVELTPTAFTALGGGAVLYKAPE